MTGRARVTKLDAIEHPRTVSVVLVKGQLERPLAVRHARITESPRKELVDREHARCVRVRQIEHLTDLRHTKLFANLKWLHRIKLVEIETRIAVCRRVTKDARV